MNLQQISKNPYEICLEIISLLFSGQLMNTGFYYARNISEDIDCFVFHDVDIIAEDDRIIYTCRGLSQYFKEGFPKLFDRDPCQSPQNFRAP